MTNNWGGLVWHQQPDDGYEGAAGTRPGAEAAWPSRAEVEAEAAGAARRVRQEAELREWLTFVKTNRTLDQTAEAAYRRRWAEAMVADEANTPIGSKRKIF
jgi:hypothetical protein